jgi:1-phosphatidylinositol-4-phosphate 5-kinase
LSPVPNFETLAAHIGNKGGKSGAFMYQTYDHRFILKTVKSSEVKTLLKMLEDLRDYLSTSPLSYLTRILGLYSVERTGKSSFYLMIMECIVPPLDQLICTFDLKGSVDGRSKLNDRSIRYIREIPTGIVCKDLDFMQTQRSLEIYADDYHHFRASLANDVEFLRNHEVMDYSLLLGLTDNEALARPFGKYCLRASQGLFCCIGVIDFLQSYNYRKRLETFGLVIRKRNQPSCVKPELYSRRFMEFMMRAIRPMNYVVGN